MHGQIKELVSNYKLSEVWLDTPIYTPPDFSFRFYTTIYEANPEILVSQRIGNEFGDIGTPGDNVIPDEASENTWEGIATTNNSWGFKSYDKDWKSPQETLFWLLENVSMRVFRFEWCDPTCVYSEEETEFFGEIVLFDSGS